MEKQKNNQKMIMIIVLGLFFVSAIVLEQIIKPTSSWAMLLVLMKKASIYALLAVSMNLLNGFTGLFSLGQAGFMLMGAYTYAVFTIPSADRAQVYTYYDQAINFSFPEVFQKLCGGVGVVIGILVAIILAGLVAAAVAYLIGLPVLRLKSDYLAIATLGFAEIIRAIFQWSKLGVITNGANPINRYVRLSVFQIKLGDFNLNLSTFATLLMATCCIGIIVLLINSSYGRAFKAIREDEIAAEAMGINLYKHKQLSFCISSFFAGIGGALLAMFMGTVMASGFKVAMTYEILLIVVLGGIGSISGSIIGSFLFIFTLEWWLRGLDSGTFLGITSPLFRSGFRLVAFSIVVMIVVLFFHRGIMGDKELPAVLKKLFDSKKKEVGDHE